MKKTLAITPLLLLLGFSPMASALNGQGTIEEIVNCGAGEPWKQVLLFKLSDGTWFGSYAEHYSKKASDKDANFATSTILMAFSAGLTVEAHISYENKTFCGIDAAMHHNKKDDYIKITK